MKTRRHFCLESYNSSLQECRLMAGKVAQLHKRGKHKKTVVYEPLRK